MTPLKALALAGLLMTAPLCSSWAATSTPPLANLVLTGEVLEVKDVESYTYLRLKTAEGETWAAVGKAPVKKGAQVRIENPMVMENFESKSLKKTFKTIVFGALAQPASVVNLAPPTPMDMGPIKVARASAANAHTVAEVVAQAKSLKDKPVTLSGKVVKFNPEIMGKNWIHLQDGSGSAANQSNDLLVTSSATVKVGDVITVTGLVRTDKDFTAGYSYKVMLEDATLVKP
jgi:hypothetical protein